MFPPKGETSVVLKEQSMFFFGKKKQASSFPPPLACRVAASSGEQRSLGGNSKHPTLRGDAPSFYFFK